MLGQVTTPVSIMNCTLDIKTTSAWVDVRTSYDPCVYNVLHLGYKDDICMG